MQEMFENFKEGEQWELPDVSKIFLMPQERNMTSCMFLTSDQFC